MHSFKGFQGVVCCCMDSDTSVPDSIFKILNLKTPSVHLDLECFELELKNKYYQTTIHLFDYDHVEDSKKTDVLTDNCHAIIIHGNGTKLTTNQLDTRLEQFSGIGGEPRILLCDSIDDECDQYRGLQDWCIKHGYELLLTSEEDVEKQLIDSLSAYRWKNSVENKPQLDEGILKKLADFDTLLTKLSAYQERPELRGDPNDKNIEEIASLLSGLLEDPDIDD